MSVVEDAVAALRKQQAKTEQYSPVRMVAEQLMDICRAEPRSAELILGDIDKTGMSIFDAEKQIKKFADAHRSGQGACVPPREAERILREFYGLGPAGGDGAGAGSPVPAPSETGSRSGQAPSLDRTVSPGSALDAPAPAPKLLDLADFW